MQISDMTTEQLEDYLNGLANRMFAARLDCPDIGLLADDLRDKLGPRMKGDIGSLEWARDPGDALPLRIGSEWMSVSSIEELRALCDEVLKEEKVHG